MKVAAISELPIRIVLLSPATPPNVVADIDIVIAARQVRAGDVAQGGVVTGSVVEKRYVATSFPTL